MKRLFRAVSGLLAGLLLVAPACAAPDASALSTWADTQFGTAVTEGRASAATVVVVQGGKPVLVRNYGFGDRAATTPIAPPRERFLIASVTKTFTATAIALLVQDGRIASLDDPANRYLKRVKLPDAFGRAITLRELLTHSAGFEERGFGVGDRQGGTGPVSGEYIRAHLPAIVRAPGSRIVYANIDPAILGIVIEDVTGMSVRDYMQRRFLAPLRMRQTELVYDPRAVDRLVRPFTGNGADRWDVNTRLFAPTGSIHTTAADMGQYLLAQLGHRPQVLPPTTVARLHTPLARNAPALDALAMAFFVSDWNGHRVIGHAGAFSGFSSDLYIVPDSDIGVFYAWAGEPAPGKGAPLDYGTLQSSFLTLALGAFRPPAPLAPQPDPSAFYGRYWQERRPQTTFEAIVAAGQVVTVGPAPGNRLTIDGKGPYYAFAPGAYAHVEPDGRQGTVYAFGESMVSTRVGAARRVSGFGDPANQVRLAGVALLLLATGLLGAVWMRGRARVLAPVIGLLALAIPVLLFILPPGLEPDIIAGRYARFLALKIDCLALLVLAAVLLWLVLRTPQSRLARWHAAAIALSAGLLLIPFAFFHLV